MISVTTTKHEISFIPVKYLILDLFIHVRYFLHLHRHTRYKDKPILIVSKTNKKNEINNPSSLQMSETYSLVKSNNHKVVV